MNKFVYLVFCAISFGLVYFYGPDVVADYRDANTIRMATDYRVDQAECSRSALIVSMCSVSFKHKGHQDKLPIVVSNMHIGNMSNELVFAVTIGSGNGRIVSNTSVSYLNSRIGAMVVFLVIGFVNLAALLRSGNAVSSVPENARSPVETERAEGISQAARDYQPAVTRRASFGKAQSFGRKGLT